MILPKIKKRLVHMGIFVRLAIMPHKISPEEWSKAYAETLFFLEECPCDLMGITGEEIGGKERTVFSRKLDHGSCFQVMGDFQSREWAESFIMYKDLKQYSERRSAGHQEDILAALSDDSQETGVSYVFDDKTQGHLYHIPMLAAAMIIEDRFPDAAHVSGDINLAQSQEAERILKSVLRREVALPICVDAHRLFTGLQKHYQGNVLLARFYNLFQGSSMDAMKAMYQLCEQSEFIQWFISKIKVYSDPNRLGVIGHFVDWLSVTQDLPTLCHLACQNKNGPQFKPVEFADSLASTWISVKSDVQEDEAAPETVGSQMSSILFDMQGFKGRNMRFHMNEESVIHVLKQHFSQDAQEVEALFLKKTEKLQGRLEEMTELAIKKEVAEKEEDPERSGDGMSFLREGFTVDHLSQGQEKMLNWIATSVGRIRKKMMEENSGLLLKKSGEELKKTIFDQSFHLRIVLAEGSWSWIDQEEDVDLLKVIAVLLYIDSQGLTFCNLRRAILENRQLCKAVLELSQESGVV